MSPHLTSKEPHRDAPLLLIERLMVERWAVRFHFFPFFYLCAFFFYIFFYLEYYVALYQISYRVPFPLIEAEYERVVR